MEGNSAVKKPRKYRRFASRAKKRTNRSGSLGFLHSLPKSIAEVNTSAFAWGCEVQRPERYIVLQKTFQHTGPDLALYNIIAGYTEQNAEELVTFVSVWSCLPALCALVQRCREV